MDTTGKGYISVNDLLTAIPGLKDMPLSGRVCNSITEASPSSGDQTQINFKLMVDTMSIYRDKSKNEQRQIRFLFRMFDINRDSKITREELSEVLREISKKQLSALTES